jgi:predicted nucleic acid-binding protein
MSEVFADTAYFIAHLNRADQYHHRVVQLSDLLERRIMTSEWIMLEWQTDSPTPAIDLWCSR